MARVSASRRTLDFLAMAATSAVTARLGSYSNGSTECVWRWRGRGVFGDGVAVGGSCQQYAKNQEVVLLRRNSYSAGILAASQFQIVVEYSGTTRCNEGISAELPTRAAIMM